MDKNLSWETQVIKKCRPTAFYAKKVCYLFTVDCHCSNSWARSIQSTSSYHNLLRSVLILFSYPYPERSLSIFMLKFCPFYLFLESVLHASTEWPPLVSEVSGHFLRLEGVAWSAQRIPTAVNPGFLDRSRYFFIQVAPQLPSRSWVDPVPENAENLVGPGIEPGTSGSSYNFTNVVSR
jgi:hypothetical protein